MSESENAKLIAEKARFEVRLHVEALLRLCYPDHITPAGVRMFERALGEYREGSHG